MTKNRDDFLGDMPEMFGADDSQRPRKMVHPVNESRAAIGHLEPLTMTWQINRCPICGTEVKVISVHRLSGGITLRWVWCQRCRRRIKAV